MRSSESRRFLSLLIAAFGVDGRLLARKDVLGAEGADLVPGAALRWPKCRCGQPKCPDYPGPVPQDSVPQDSVPQDPVPEDPTPREPVHRAPETPTGTSPESLGARLAERNRRSSRGGV